MSSQEAGTLTVPPTALDLHQALWYASDRIAFALRWAGLVALWLLSIAVFFGIGLIYSPATPLGFVDLYLGVIVFAATGVYALREAIRAARSLSKWETEMTPFMYSIKFEMLPFTSGDREGDIWERFVSVYPALERMSKPRGILPWTRRKTEVRFRATVKGKGGNHFFHIFGRYKDDEFFFVRRYEGNTLVTKDDLATFKGEVEDVIRRVGAYDFSLATFAVGGYDQKAIEYAGSSEGLVRDEQRIDLFAETPNGYRVVFVSTN
jgi:hypothetical protein